MYLTAGELVSIILSESYWKLFKPYLPTTTAVIKTKLLEVACIRNALAHFRPVTPAQVEIIKQNGTQILTKFQAELKEILFTPLPTKYPRWRLEWPVKGCANPVLLSCSFTVSKNRRWAFAYLSAEAQNVRMETFGETCILHVNVLDLDKFFDAFPGVRKRCVIATEECSAGLWDGDSKAPAVRKIFRMVFPTPQGTKDQKISVAQTMPEELLPDFAKTLAKPLTLLSSHVLPVLELKLEQETAWRVDTGNVFDETTLSKFPENWKKMTSPDFEAEFLTSCPKYPWMNLYTPRDV
jgi:hypothetical protein